MYKGTKIINRSKVYKQIQGLRHDGRTEREIEEILGLTTATVQYLTSINMPTHPVDYDNCGRLLDQKLRLAYEMREAGKSFVDISQRLQVNISRARRMVHRYSWILRHPK